VAGARDRTAALVLVDAKRVELVLATASNLCVFTEPDAISAGLVAASGLVDDRSCLMEANAQTS
jgi:hypothetical protein